MNAPKFDRNHPDFPWGFYSIGKNIAMVTNSQHAALSSGTAVLEIAADKVDIVPVAGKPKGFKFFK